LSHPPRRSGRRDLPTAAGRVRVTRPSPVPSSGFLPLSTVLAALAARSGPRPCGVSSPFAVTPRRFAALFHAARAHWSRPTELSLPEEPYPLSRALSPLWVRADRPTARLGPRVSRLLSPFAPTSRRGWPEGSPDSRSRDDGSPESLGRRTCHVAVVVCDVSSRNGRAHRTRRPNTPTSELCSPRESVLGDDRLPGQGSVDRSVLSWTFSPLEPAPAARGFGARADERRSGRTRASCVLGTR